MDKYRVGRRRPNNIYEIASDNPDEDEPIGVIWKDPQIAIDVVRLLNAAYAESLCTCYTTFESNCPLHHYMESTND